MWEAVHPCRVSKCHEAFWREGGEVGFQGIRPRDKDGEIKGNITYQNQNYNQKLVIARGFIYACFVNCCVTIALNSVWYIVDAQQTCVSEREQWVTRGGWEEPWVFPALLHLYCLSDQISGVPKQALTMFSREFLSLPEVRSRGLDWDTGSKRVMEL